jgi:hypothetical protein
MRRIFLAFVVTEQQAIRFGERGIASQVRTRATLGRRGSILYRCAHRVTPSTTADECVKRVAEQAGHYFDLTFIAKLE